MAVPISKTWLQMQLMSGGSTCKEVQALANINYPGLTDATVIDALTWNNQMRAANIAHFPVGSIIREMTAAQRKTLVLWALAQLKLNLPVGWAHTAAVSARLDDVIDCINAPSPAKRAALQTFASSIVLDYDDPKDKYLRQQMKRICNLVANQVNDHIDVYKTVVDLASTLRFLTGLTKAQTDDAVLTKIEQIIGIRD